MVVKKAPSSATPAGSHRKQLQYLVARRTAIDALIQTLEDYDRFRALGVPDRKRKLA
jgi:hypothetical protein